MAIFLFEDFEYSANHAVKYFMLEFIIDIDGKLLAPRIKGKIDSNLTEVEKEVINLLKNAPKWKPGVCNGKSVPVKIFLPLKL